VGHIHTEVHWDAPVERVFAVAVDLTLLPDVMTSVKDVTDLRGAGDEVGSTCRFHSSFLGRTMAGTVEVLEVERPSLFRTLTTYDSGPRVTWTQHFTPSGAGTDEVDDVDYELPPGITAALFGPLVRRKLERAMRDSVGPFSELVMTRLPSEPKPARTPVVSDEVRRIWTELADVGIAARRALGRLRLARVIIAAAAQVVIAFIAWRIWVWRARRRRQ
jgi:hypothetical protein